MTLHAAFRIASASHAPNAVSEFSQQLYSDTVTNYKYSDNDLQICKREILNATTQPTRITCISLCGKPLPHSLPFSYASQGPVPWPPPPFLGPYSPAYISMVPLCSLPQRGLSTRKLHSIHNLLQLTAQLRISGVHALPSHLIGRLENEKDYECVILRDLAKCYDGSSRNNLYGAPNLQDKRTLDSILITSHCTKFVPVSCWWYFGLLILQSWVIESLGAHITVSSSTSP